LTQEQEEALYQARELDPTPKNMERVAKTVGLELARWAFTQWELRDRAKAKFAKADEMLFTRDGLEMASHETVAALHAFIFDARCRVDLTCGIGSDLIAFAARADSSRGDSPKVPVPVGLDIDPEHVACANHNLRVHGFKGRAICFDSSRFFDRGRRLEIFFDPQRRTHGRRTLDPSQFTPDVRTVLGNIDSATEIMIKLSPMLPDSFLNSLGGRVCFVSHQRQCCEALVLQKCLMNWGDVGAFHAESMQLLYRSPLAEILPAPLDFVHEADPAAIRGHCLGTFNIPGLGDSNGYLTSNHIIESLWLRSYKVLWSGAWRLDKVKVAAANLSAKVVAVKCRGVDVDVVKVGKELKADHGDPVILILFPVGMTVRAVLAEAM